MKTQTLNKSYTLVRQRYNMGTKVRVKQWGNSLGVILPKELVEKRDLKKGGEILIEIVNPTQFNKIFGSLKLKRSTEELMKIAREGWK